MVVFGAGASYDSVPTLLPGKYVESIESYRPPLANQLFDNRPNFADAIRRFPKCQQIIRYLQARPKNVSVERRLELLQSEAKGDPVRHQQLAAIRWYLHYIIWECDARWNEKHAATNHITLLDQIRRTRKSGELVSLVTFNYDRLLEVALLSLGHSLERLEDYVRGKEYQLFKLHGSVHWAHEVEAPIPNIENLNAWQVAYELIDRMPRLEVSPKFRIVSEYPIGKFNKTPLFPALAIPIEKKAEEFECPREHVDALGERIPHVTKILTIGWRANELHFLRLIKQSQRRAVRVMAVSGSIKSGRLVVNNMRRAGIRARYSISPFGFSDFADRREAEKFLRS